MKRDIFTFTINEMGREKFFVVGVGWRQHIIVCSSMQSALGVHDRLEMALGVDLKVLALKGGTVENFEAGATRSPPPGMAHRRLGVGFANTTAYRRAVALDQLFCLDLFKVIH
jgi:hypothetical protein